MEIFSRLVLKIKQKVEVSRSFCCILRETLQLSRNVFSTS